MKRIETKVLFRCSGLGDLMTNAQGKSNLEKYNDCLSDLEKAKTTLSGLSEKAIITRDKTIAKIEKLEAEILDLEKVKDDVKLSVSCRKYLKTMAIEIRYKRKKRMTNKYIKKGIAVENASIELYSEWKGIYMENNKQRFEDEDLTGETDIDIKDVQGNVIETDEIKSSYDIDSFEDNRDEEAKKANFYQGQGYCKIRKLKRFRIANVLTNNDFMLINDEIGKEKYKVKEGDLEGFDVSLVRVLEIAKDHIFDYDSYILFLQNSPFIHSDTLKELINDECEDSEAQQMFNDFVEVELDDRVIVIEIERCEETENLIKSKVPIWRKHLADVYNIHHVA